MLDALFNDVFRLDVYVLKLNFLGCSDDRAAHRRAPEVCHIPGQFPGQGITPADAAVLRVGDDQAKFHGLLARIASG